MISSTSIRSSLLAALICLTLPNVASAIIVNTPATLPNATVNTAWSYSIPITGTGPYTVQIISGSVPIGFNTVSGSYSPYFYGTFSYAGSYNFTIMVIDNGASGANTTRSITLNVIAPVSITTGSVPNATAGQAYSQSLAATGGASPYSWSVSAGSLPPGLSLNSAGTISGTPSTIGSYSFTARVADAGSQSATKSYSLLVGSTLAISTGAIPNGIVGTAYSAASSTSGGVAPYSWTLTSGSLPPGLSLSSSGMITGTPTTPGSSNFTAQVTDGSTQSLSQAYVMAIYGPLAYTTTSPLQSALVGSPYSATIVTTGGSGVYNYGVSGTVAPGLSSTKSGENLVWSGTPTTRGTYTWTNAVCDTGTPQQCIGRDYTLTVYAPPVLTVDVPSNNGSVYPGSIMSGWALDLDSSIQFVELYVDGVKKSTVNIGSPARPDACALSNFNLSPNCPNVGWTIPWDSSWASAGSHTISFVAWDSDGVWHNTSQTLSVTVYSALSISTTSLPSTLSGATYSQSLSAIGAAAPASWSVAAGSLPPGLSLSAAGVISGTASSAGTYTFTAQISDGIGRKATQALSIQVIQQLAVATASIPNGLTNAAYSQTLAASGGTPSYSWSLASGILPPGVTLSPAGVLSGTPTAAGSYSFTVKVTDSTAPTPQSATQSLSLSLAVPLSVTTSSLPNALAGSAYSQTLSPSGGTPGYTWSIASGSLPSGLTLNSAGTISGTPTATGTYSFTAQVSDSTSPAPQTASKAFSITVTASLSIITTALSNGLATSPYSYSLAASGGTAPYSWSIAAGALPAGLALSSAGVISGTPTLATTATLSIQATDSTSPTAQTAMKALTITIGSSLSITSTALPNGLATSPYSQSLSASGGTTPYAWSLASGSLPTGLSLTSAGLISGTPTTAGSFSFTVKATDATSPTAQTATQALSITISRALTVTTSSLPPAVVNVNYVQTLAAAGGTSPYTWSLASGSLPPGFTLGPSGTLSGNAAAPGTYTFVVQATDSTNPTHLTATQSLTLTVNAALGVTTVSLPATTQGQPYSATLTATGGVPPYTWSVSTGSLPAGLTLDPTTGAISGTPSAYGTFSFSVRVTDSNANTATRSFNLAIAQALTITTPSLPTGIIGMPYTHTLTGEGGTAPYSWSVSAGSLPNGLSLTAQGVLSGTPTDAGSFSVTIKLTDAAFQSTTQAYTLHVIAPLAVSASLADGVQGVPYNASLTATGGTTPYTWTLASGSLPNGLSLSPAGTITGTAAVSGSATFTVQITDSTNPTQTATATLTLNIHAPLTIVTTTLPHARETRLYSQPLIAAGGTTPYTWSVTSGALPPGLSLSSAGLLSGTPIKPGSSSFTVTVADATNPAQSQVRDFTLITDQAFGIDTVSLPSGVETTPYSQSLSASQGVTPYFWSLASGTLPPGLSLNSDGTIAGTPATAGKYNFVVQANDSNATPRTATAALSITIQPKLILQTTALPDSALGVQYSQPLVTIGGVAPYAWLVISGKLPNGLTLDASGAITGIPTLAGTYIFTIQVSDLSSPTQIITRAFTINVSLGVAIATPSLPDAYIHQPYSQALAAVGGTTPYTWSIASGSLPLGLSLSPDGTLSGSPTATGTSSFTIRVTDAASPAHSATKAFTLRVRSSLTIDTASLPEGTVNVPYTLTFTASNGTTPYAWRISSGALPSGLSLDSNGILSGTPTAAGAFGFSIQVTDAAALTDTREYVLTVAQGFHITTTSISPAAPNVAYSVTFTAAAGTTPYTWSVPTGTLPPGLGIDPATGTLSGTPTTNGSYSFTVKTTDNTGAIATRVFSLPVGPALTIATKLMQDARLGTMYRQPLQAINGTPPYLWTLTEGQLPEGLVLLASGDIIGQPTAAGASTFTLTVSDSAQPPAQASQSFTLTVQSGFLITTAALPGAAPGGPYLTSLAAANGLSPYTWSITLGTLPDGLTLDPISGIISGTPKQPGVYPLLIQASDSSSPAMTTTRQFLLSVGTDLSITTGALPTAVVGSVYDLGLTATNGIQPYTWSAAALPPGLALLSSGELYGIPAEPGEYEILFTVADSSQTPAVATRSLRLLVTRNLTILTDALPQGSTRKPYSAAILAAGGRPPFSFAPSGTLPPGLSLTANGILSGTPASEGSFSFTVTVTDDAAATTKAHFTVTIGNTLTISRTTLPDGITGSRYFAFLTATGGAAPFTWSVASLPDGLTLMPSLGLIVGTPATVVDLDLPVTVTDSASHTATALVSLHIAQQLTIPPATLPTAQTGSSYVAQITAVGGTPPYRWSASEPLPSGLSLSDNGTIQGTINSQPGAVSLSLCVTDAASPAARACTVRTIIVGPAFAIDPLNLPATPRGQAISYQFTTSGAVGPAVFSPAFPLPSGVTLSADGLLAGTPQTAGTYRLTLLAVDAAQQTATADFVLTITPPLMITSAALPTGVAGSRYVSVLSAASGSQPYSWSLASSLPDGLTFDSAGIITGLPLNTGSTPLQFTVSDSAGATASAELTLTVASTLSITSLSLPAGIATLPYNAQVTAAGGTAPYTWSIASGTLPNGLSLSPDGAIAGTPTTAGTSVLVFSVSDSTLQTQGIALAISITDSLGIPSDSTSLPTGTVGVDYAASLKSNYGSDVSWTLILGDLPAGLMLASDGSITGVPTVVGMNDFIVRASASDQHTDQLYSIKVVAGTVANPTELTLQEPSFPAAVTGQPYTVAITASGGKQPYAWTITDGQLPPGLALVPGSITGTPTTPGIYRAIAAVSDASAQTAAALVSIVVRQSLTTDRSIALEQHLGAAADIPLTVAGGMPGYRWSLASGSLPPGLTLAPSGAIVGTPTTVGAYSAVLAVRDSGTPQLTGSLTVTIRVTAGLTITTASLPVAYPQVPYITALTASGGTAPYTWSLSGALPTGVVFTADGLISGTPERPGLYTLSVQVTDSAAQSSSTSLTLNVAALAITTATLPGATPKSPYSVILAASGGVPPYAWSLVGGALPDGLSFTREGLLSGTPNAPTKTSISTQVSDSSGATATATFALVVGLPSVGAVHLSPLPDPLQPASQIPLTLTVDTAPPIDITGTLTLAFQPLQPGREDQGTNLLQPDRSAVRIAPFTIRAGSTSADLPALQSGTLAGTLTLTAELPVDRQAPTVQQTRINSSAPVITLAHIVKRDDYSLQIEISGYSTTGEIRIATFAFASTGPVPQPQSLNVQPLFDSWFLSEAGKAQGGAFTYTQTINLSAPCRTLNAAIITLTNTIGPSQQYTVNF